MASRRVRCPSCDSLLQVRTPPFVQTIQCPRCHEVNSFRLGNPSAELGYYRSRTPRPVAYPEESPAIYRPSTPRPLYPDELPSPYNIPASPWPSYTEEAPPPSPYGSAASTPLYGDETLVESRPNYYRPMPQRPPHQAGMTGYRRPPPVQLSYREEAAVHYRPPIPRPVYGAERPGYGYSVADTPAPRLTLQPSSAYGRKRAVLCGVSYYGRKYQLQGSVNDVKRMKYFLIDTMGFPEDCIFTLTEDELTPQGIPTKRNIQNALRWLVQGCQSGDSLVFYYSGLGSRVQDRDMDEIDGYDEALCPVDHETQGKIIDDVINAIIVRPLPPGAKLHAIVDASYSGTILDLPFVCRINRGGQYTWEDQRCQSGGYKGTRGGLAVSITACDDDQTTEDAMALTGSSVGSLTDSFIRAAENEPALTYGRLISLMRATIFQTKSAISAYTYNTPQEPQLSSSDQFDIYSRKFIL